MKRLFTTLIATTLLGAACAPKVEERLFTPAKTLFGPRHEDTDLFKKDLKQSSQKERNLSWQGHVTTDQFFQQAEHLIALGNLTTNSRLKDKGHEWIEKFYVTPQATRFVDVAQSPFAALVIAQTQTEVKKTLDEINLEIKHSQDVVSANITRLGKNYPWPNGTLKLINLLSVAKGFSSTVLDGLHSFGLNYLIEDGILTEFEAQTGPLFIEVEELIKRLESAQTLSQTLDLVISVIAKFEMTLDPELTRSLEQGKVIAAGLDNIHDAQGGLTVLVDIWRILTAEERANYFKAANEDLYDFLKDQDEKELECLRTPGCNGGIFKGIAKKVFVLPKIKNYGLEILKAEMNQKTQGYVISVIETFATSFIKELPKTFMEKINVGLGQKGKEILLVRNNYPDYVKRILGTWAKKALPATNGKVAGFENSELSLNVSNSQPLTIQIAGDTQTLTAKTAGSSIMINALRMESAQVEKSQGLDIALSQVNKLISIGGYRDSRNNLIPALLSPLKKGQRNLDILDLAQALPAYTIPDKIVLRDGFHADAKAVYPSNFSASAYAEQLRGISRMLQVMADWKETNFDKILGPIKAQDLTDQIDSEALQRPLFPKDMLFALNLGEAAVLLQNITKQETPVFLLTLNDKTLWANFYSSSSESAAMAGIVDIIDGKKSNTVRSRDVAQLILAIAEFLEGTEGVENTKSSILLEADKNGIRPLDTLLEGRNDLKLLVVALANFLSNKLMADHKLIQSAYDLNTNKTLSAKISLEDQAYGIRALIKAWKWTELDTYLWSAQEIYYSLNQSYFENSEFFYQNDDGTSLTFPEKLHVMRAILELRPTLNSKSQLQVDKILKPWLSAVERMK